MSLLKTLKHLFVPHESNNQKAKILHTESLLLLVLVMVGFQFILNIGSNNFPSVLGYAANISPSEVISMTNQQRMANGLAPLTENKTLDSAALAKGQDMISKNYWAHFAPDGTSPWSFFTNFGYKYQYAGENLARDFSNASSAVSAWMDSPTHKENILNPHYKEIGIGVIDGSLLGADTTIIVQFFGTALTDSPSIPVAKAREQIAVAVFTPSPNPASAATPIAVSRVLYTPLPTLTPSPSPTLKPAAFKVLVSPFQSTKNLSLGVVGALLLILTIDVIAVKRLRIVRIGGRTLAHIIYLSMILAVILILKAGQII